MSIRRPKPGEDDLEEMSKQFEADRAKAAASVSSPNIVNKRPNAEQESSKDGKKKQKSLFSQQRQKKNENKTDPKYQIPEAQEKSDEQENVLTEIVEKNLFGQINVSAPVLPEANKASKHFPDIIKIIDNNSDSQPESKRSLFSQQFQHMKKSIPEVLKQKKTPEGDLNLSALGNASHIINGTGLEIKDDISSLHEENMNTLKQMSEQEIMEEKEKLTNSLDPKLLEFLKSRRNTAKVYLSNQDVEMCEAKDVVANEATIASAAVTAPTKDSSPNLTEFPNMSRSEPEKLSWTGDLPPVKPGQFSGFSARFGFDGLLLAPDSDIPVTAGLHHHGEEQERPGYTVEEMVTLVRSSNSRQRAVGLELLQKVLKRWWNGELDYCLEQNMVEELLSSGLVELLRISLDCTEKGVMVAGAKCMAALLYNEEEERVLDWEVGTRQPGFRPVGDLEEVERMTDHQLVVQDVVLGLIRMDILPRLKYLLDKEKVELDNAMVTALLAILVRIGRHSMGVAEGMSRHQVLASVVSRHWDNPLAVKLVRVLAGWGRHIAHSIIMNHKLSQLLGPHLAAGSDTMQDTQLCVEAHRTWALLLGYGICQQLWVDLSHVTLTRLVALYHREQLEKASCVGSWLLLVSNQAVSLASEQSNPPNMVQWEQVVGLRDIMENCVRKWLAQLGQREELVTPNFGQLLSVLASCLAAYYRTLANYDKCELVKFLDQLEEFFTSVLLRFLSCPYYSACLSSLMSSCYLDSSLSLSTRQPVSIPSVGAYLQGGLPHPLLTAQSQVILLEGVLDLVLTVTNIHKKLKPLLTQTLSTTVPHVNAFLSKLVNSSPSLSSHWFSRPSSLLLHSLLELYSPNIPSLSHPTALTLASLVHTQDSPILLNLFNNYLFNPAILSPDCLSSRLSSLSLSTPLPNSSGQPPPAPLSVVQASLTHLPSIMSTYRQLLLPAASPVSPTPSQRKSTTCRHSGETLLPSDWPYFPLLSLYNSTQTPATKTSPPLVSSDQIQWSLSWLTLLPPSLPTPRYLRLCTVLLSPGSLFLYPNIHSLLHLHLTSLLSHGSGPDLSQSLPGISSNLDLYQQMLDQFSAESYGDLLFSMYLVIPLSMSQPIAFRRILWTEKTEILPLIWLTPEQISPWSVSRFLDPPETDISVLMAYFKSVAEGVVTKARNGLLYAIAAGHIKMLLSSMEDMDGELSRFKKFVEGEFNKNPQLADLLMQ